MAILQFVLERCCAKWMYISKFFLKLAAMAMSLEELEKEFQIDSLRTNTYHLVK